ncbi:MAG TPA: DUF4336 domain-containing protein [Telluria sp.]
MLQAIAPNLWHLQHGFSTLGIGITSRMTVVRFGDGRLWLHSPVPLSVPVREQLASLGEVAFIVAPNKVHHLFAGDAAKAFPAAALFGAPGLAQKRPGLRKLRTLAPTVEPEWSAELDQVFADGFPFANETVFYHKASRTVIMTDLCQWWTAPNLNFGARLYARATGVRAQLEVPRSIRAAVRDPKAFAASARSILAWPFERVIVAHDAILDTNAHAAVEHAFACFTDKY